MKAYSIFDDYPTEAIEILKAAGVEVTIHPHGIPRPDDEQMAEILRNYDTVIIGTSQKLSQSMLSCVDTPKIIATASVGTDHIDLPENKKDYITILNTPNANAQSVAEYTIGCALSCIKRLHEGAVLYSKKMNNKQLFQKPEDLSSKTIGVVGAGNISQRIMKYAEFFGMKILCWTAHPSKYSELSKMGVKFVGLDELAIESDIVSVNLPSNTDTANIIDEKFIANLKKQCIFISISRLQVVDWHALLAKARENRGFYVCLDVDLDDSVADNIAGITNVQITPHIAGGTLETRRRMFLELAVQIAQLVK